MITKLQRHVISALVLGAGISVGVIATAEQPPDRPIGHAKTSKADLNDAQILGIADTANGGEVEQANMAIAKAQTSPVKQFALLMVKEHTAAKEKGRQIAKELGVTPAPSGLSNGVQKDSDDVKAKLDTASSTDIDRTYMQAQVRLHEKVLKMLDELIPKASADPVKALLTEMRGHVEHHLVAARATLGVMNK